MSLEIDPNDWDMLCKRVDITQKRGQHFREKGLSKEIRKLNPKKDEMYVLCGIFKSRFLSFCSKILQNDKKQSFLYYSSIPVLLLLLISRTELLKQSSFLINHCKWAWGTDDIFLFYIKSVVCYTSLCDKTWLENRRKKHQEHLFFWSLDLMQNSFEISIYDFKPT